MPTNIPNEQPINAKSKLEEINRKENEAAEIAAASHLR
jgi:hypothetical protein